MDTINPAQGDPIMMELFQSLMAKDQDPFAALEKIRPMLPPREQKFIDVMIKIQEIRVLMKEMDM